MIMPSSTESTEVKKTFDYETTILNLLVDERLENLFNSTNDAASSSSVEISSSSSNLNTGLLEPSISLTTYPSKSESVENSNPLPLPAAKKIEDNDKKRPLINDEQAIKKASVEDIPAPPPLPVHLFNKNSDANNSLFSSCSEKNIKKNTLKHINWEKIENKSLTGTLWEKVNF